MTRTQRLNWPCYSLLVLSVALAAGAVAHTAAVGAPSEQQWELGSQLALDPFTIRTTVRVDDNWEIVDSCRAGEIALVGLTTELSARRGLLVSWACDNRGWFPRWSLGLRREAGWNPSPTAGGEGSGGGEAVELTLAWPEAGHTYDVMLSYSRATGEGALRVTDCAQDAPVYVGEFRTAKVAGPLYPLVGSSGAMSADEAAQDEEMPNEKPPAQAIIDVYDAFIPVSTEWQLCAASDAGCGSRLRFEPNEQLSLKLTAPGGLVGGTYSLWLEDGTARTLLATMGGVPGSSQHQQLATPLPIGAATIVLEYEKDGRVLWTDARRVVNGSITVVAEPVSVQREQGMVAGVLRVGGEHLPAIPLSVRVTMNKLAWNEATHSSEVQPYQVLDLSLDPIVPSPATTVAAFSFPTPVDPGLYTVDFDVTSPVGIALLARSPETTINIYPPGEAMRPEAPISPAYQLVWHDEFDGNELDQTKWDYRALGPRKSGVVTREAVAMDGQGHLVLTTSQLGNEYHTGMIGSQGRFTATYGYFETRVKFPTAVGHWGAFWLQSPTYGRVIGDVGKSGTEIDIFEVLGSQRDTLYMNLHWDGYGVDHKTTGSRYRNADLAEGFHVVGLEWTPTEYVFYVDGKVVWRSNQAVSHAPQYIILSLEVGPWAGDITQSNLPDSVIFDYVRVYQKQE